jgi:hypothetical protein
MMSVPDGPRSLAESITLGHGSCPIPETHDRLDECHYWWHQMARNYHEPANFRWSFGAFVQAARNVTWILQAEKSSFDDFDDWYTRWQSRAKTNTILEWLNETRVTLTKRAALAPRSWARFRCLFEQVDPGYDPDEEEDLFVWLNPFKCTHAYIREGLVENHGHEYQRSWEVAEIPDRELLDVCAEIYDLLAEIVVVAHSKVGASMKTVTRAEGDGELRPAPSSNHRLPCMDDTEAHRTVSTYVRDGQEVWDNSPEHL